MAMITSGSSDSLATSALPIHLSTNSRQWVSLSLVMFSCMLAASPLGSFSTLEPLLVRGQLFSGDTSQLNNVYSVSQTILCFSALPAGMFYDTFGGRASGTLGAILTGIALLLDAFALWNASDCSWVFYIGYCLGSVTGYLVANAVLPFLWIFPNRQGFVSGVFSAAVFLSDLFSYLAVYFNNAYQLRLQSFFVILAAACAIPTLVCYLLVPSRALTLALARNLVGVEAISKPSLRMQLWTVWRALKENRLLCTSFVIYNTLFFSSFTVISGSFYPYYKTMFTEDDATNLVDAFALVFGLGSGVVGLAGGWICDCIGMIWFATSGALFILLTLICIATPLVWAQYAAQVLLTIALGQYLVLSVRFWALYCAAEAIGTCIGIAAIFMGLGNLIISTTVTNVMDSSSNVDSFRLPFIMLLGLSFLFGMGLVAQWCNRPPPVPLGID